MSELFYPGYVILKMRRKHLESPNPIDGWLQSAVDYAHAAFAEFIAYLIGADLVHFISPLLLFYP